MPRKVDYASRFEFFRQAAFAIVRDRGVSALSRRALADELGTSRNRVDDLLRADAHLPALAAEHVRSRRRTGRFRLGTGSPDEAAFKLIASLLPDHPARIDEELVWLRLRVETTRTRSPGQDTDGPLWQQYQVAARGYVFAPRPTESSSHDSQDVERTPLADLIDQRDQEVELTLRRAREPFSVATDEGDDVDESALLARLHALVDGLTVAVCTGRLSPEQATEVVRDEVRGWTLPTAS